MFGLLHNAPDFAKGIFPVWQHGRVILPHPQCAACLIRNESGQVLLVHQNYGRGFWGFPGGLIEPGETARQAAVREAREEVGCEVELTGLVGLYLMQGGNWPDVLAHVFTATITQGAPQVVDANEIAGVVWQDPAHFPDLLVPDAEAALEDWRAGRTGVVRSVKRRIPVAPV